METSQLKNLYTLRCHQTWRAAGKVPELNGGLLLGKSSVTKWRCSFMFDCQSVDLRCFTFFLPSDPRVLEKMGRPEFIRVISASNGACGACGTLDQTTVFPVEKRLKARIQ
jgi:hypothetical protein